MAARRGMRKPDRRVRSPRWLGSKGHYAPQPSPRVAPRSLPALLLLSCALVAPLASAAEDPESGLRLDPLDLPPNVRGGRSVELTWEASAYTANQSNLLIATVRLPAGSNWMATVVPDEVILPPGGSRTFVVKLEADNNPAPREIELVLEILAIQGTRSIRLVESTTIAAVGHELVLDRWKNPLPAPLDGATGVFLLELAAWALIAAAAILVVAPLAKKLTARTKTELDQHIFAIVATPAFILIFTHGIRESVEVFDLPGWMFLTLDRAWQVILVAVVTYVVYRVWKEVVLSLGRRITSRTASELDDRLYPVFEKLGSVVILLAGLFYIIEGFGVDMTLFAAGGAVISLVVAFAAQDTLGNFFAGIFILLDQPFREGDRIEIREEETWGDVIEIGLRSTRIRTRDNRMVIVPNAVIGNNSVVNHSFPDATYRIGVNVGIAYGTDVERAREVMIEAVKGVDAVMKDQRIEALFEGFGDSSLNFHVRAWFPHFVDKRRYEDKLNTALNKALEDAGIEIPFPQRVIWDGRRERGDTDGPGVGPVGDR